MQCACDICAYPECHENTYHLLGLKVNAGQQKELESIPGPLGSAGIRHGHRRVSRRLPPLLGGRWDGLILRGGIVARRRGDAGGGSGGGFRSAGSAATHDVRWMGSEYYVVEMQGGGREGTRCAWTGAVCCFDVGFVVLLDGCDVRT